MCIVYNLCTCSNKITLLVFVKPHSLQVRIAVFYYSRSLQLTVPRELFIDFCAYKLSHKSTTNILSICCTPLAVVELVNCLLKFHEPLEHCNSTGA